MWYKEKRFKHRPVVRTLINGQLYCEYCGRGVTQRLGTYDNYGRLQYVHYGFRVFNLER